MKTTTLSEEQTLTQKETWEDSQPTQTQKLDHEKFNSFMCLNE